MNIRPFIDGNPVTGQVVTLRMKRWHWLPQFFLRFKWATVPYQVYQFDAAPPAGSVAVVSYETVM